MTDNDRLIIEVSSEGFRDYDILKLKSESDDDSPVLFTDGQKVKVQRNVCPDEISNFDFVFIRDDYRKISLSID